jgi:glycosyltransferase involved in cell wall biosynthesis
LLNRPLVDVAARRADAIITVSESAKRDIVRLYGSQAERIHVVHEAAAPAFQPIRDPAVLERVRRRYDLAERFILYVGTIEPRKNLPKLIEGFASRRKSGQLPHQLVCAGPYGWLSRDIEDLIDRLQIEDAVRFTGYVPFDDLATLYSLAEMFVFPSLYEGFGLPVIEAMACGTPVVTSNGTSLPEVVADSAVLVDPEDVDSIAAGIQQMLSNPGLRERLRRSGLERAKCFTWERAATRTLRVLLDQSAN